MSCHMSYHVTCNVISYCISCHVTYLTFDVMVCYKWHVMSMITTCYISHVMLCVTYHVTHHVTYQISCHILHVMSPVMSDMSYHVLPCHVTCHITYHVTCHVNCHVTCYITCHGTSHVMSHIASYVTYPMTRLGTTVILYYGILQCRSTHSAGIYHPVAMSFLLLLVMVKHQQQCHGNTCSKQWTSWCHNDLPVTSQWFGT